MNVTSCQFARWLSSPPSPQAGPGSAKRKAARALRPGPRPPTGRAPVGVPTSTIDLDPDAHGHLDLGALRIFDGPALLDPLKPVLVLALFPRLDHRALHRL